MTISPPTPHPRICAATSRCCASGPPGTTNLPRRRCRRRGAPNHEFGARMLPKPFTPDADLLAGRVILITGAGSGLGRALAVECARVDASVILCGRNLAKLERVYDEIESLGRPRPALATLDLAAATAVDYDNLAATIGDEFGKLDGLVHAAALLGDRTPLEQYDVPT